MQGSTLSISRLPGASNIQRGASENYLNPTRWGKSKSAVTTAARGVSHFVVVFRWSRGRKNAADVSAQHGIYRQSSGASVCNRQTEHDCARVCVMDWLHAVAYTHIARKVWAMLYSVYPAIAMLWPEPC